MPILRCFCLLAASTAVVALRADDAGTPPAPAPVPVAAPPRAGAPAPWDLDLRLGIGSSPGISTVKDKSTGVTTDVDRDGGGDIDLELIYVHAWPGGLGFAAGGGVFAHSHRADVQGQKPEIDASGIEGQAALVYRFNRGFHIEAPALVIALGSAKATKLGMPDSQRGGYGSFGLQAGAYYSFRFGLQIGAAIGVMGWSATVKQQNGTGGTDNIEYSGGGGYADLQAGFRF
jgi:hypothetical protein